MSELREKVALEIGLATYVHDMDVLRAAADAAIALIRAATLEEAADEAEHVVAYGESQAVMRENIAAAIRALGKP